MHPFFRPSVCYFRVRAACLTFFACHLKYVWAHQVTIQGEKVSVSLPVAVDKPVVVLRKIKHAGKAAVLSLLDRFGPTRVQLVARSADVEPNMAIGMNKRVKGTGECAVG